MILYLNLNLLIFSIINLDRVVIVHMTYLPQPQTTISFNLHSPKIKYELAFHPLYTKSVLTKLARVMREAMGTTIIMNTLCSHFTKRVIIKLKLNMITVTKSIVFLQRPKKLTWFTCIKQFVNYIGYYPSVGLSKQILNL
jgi:hypothetical protein